MVWSTVHHTTNATLQLIVVQVRIIEHQLVPSLSADLPNGRCRIVVFADLDSVVLVVFLDVIQSFSHSLIIPDSGGGCIIQMKILDRLLRGWMEDEFCSLYPRPIPFRIKLNAFGWRHVPTIMWVFKSMKR